MVMTYSAHDATRRNLRKVWLCLLAMCASMGCILAIEINWPISLE